VRETHHRFGGEQFVNPSTAAALFVAVPLAGLGLASAAFQVRGMRRLAARTHVPSDEFAYLRNRHRRRLLASAMMVVIAGLIAGAYLSGMENRADALGEHDPNAPRDEAGKRVIQPDERLFVRAWGTYWVLAIVLVFAWIGIAVLDARASLRYWMGVYQQMKEDHQTKLRRDLAVFQQQKHQQRGTGRAGYGGRLGGE
jgi:hypothetical protein